MKLQIGQFDEAQEIWDFVNQYFSYTYPYPDVAFYLFTPKNWQIFNSISKWNPQNISEIERIKNHPEIPETETDAGMFDREENKQTWKNHSENELIKLFSEHRFTIVMKKGATTKRGKMFTQKAGFSVKDYYHFHILHEFIHILERLTKRQLLVDELQDWRMFYLYKDYDGELVESPII